ncbi:MAG: DUF262 domain-containing protein [Aureispira sp.]
MSELRINTRVRRLFHYLEDFERGIIRIPVFQRDLEWSDEQKIRLFDSIKQGYPIGSIFFWRPDKRLTKLGVYETHQIGAYQLPKEEEDYFYILDGYQRLSTLFGCLVNPKSTRLQRLEEEWNEEFNFVYDLEEDKVEKYKKNKASVHRIPLYELAGGDGFFDFQERLIEEKIPREKVELYSKRYRDFSKKLFAYDIPSIELAGGEMKEAIDVFIRLNSTGTMVKDHWILSALSFDGNFRLGTEVEKCIQSISSNYNFKSKNKKDTFLEEAIYQAINGAFGYPYFDAIPERNIKKLGEVAGQVDFVAKTKETLEGFEQTIAFLSRELCVWEKRLLPYKAQLQFLAAFFRENRTNISKEQIERLKYWFWKTTYTNYFTENNLAGQRDAYYQFKKHITTDVEAAIYKSGKTKSSKVFPKKINLGSARATALVLFMLNYQLDYTKGLDKRNISINYKKYDLFSSPKTVQGVSDFANAIYDGIGLEIDKKQHKDLSYWLESDQDYGAFFISEEMKVAYQNGALKTEILRMRETLIMEAERIKIELLNILVK